MIMVKSPVLNEEGRMYLNLDKRKIWRSGTNDGRILTQVLEKEQNKI